MLTRTKKEEIVAGLRDGIEKADALFLTNLIGVSANESVEIRKKVRDKNVLYFFLLLLKKYWPFFGY